MLEKNDFSNIDFEIDPEDYLFDISAVCEMLSIPYWTVRTLIKEKIIKPKKVGKKKKLFCLKDIKLMERIRYLMKDRHVNIEGIKIILEIEKE